MPVSGSPKVREAARWIDTTASSPIVRQCALRLPWHKSRYDTAIDSGDMMIGARGSYVRSMADQIVTGFFRMT